LHACELRQRFVLGRRPGIAAHYPNHNSATMTSATASAKVINARAGNEFIASLPA
jgi:hypothetical protein